MVDFVIRVVVDPSGAVRGGRQVEGQLGRIDRQADRTRRLIERAFTFAAVTVATRQLIRYADTFTLVQNRLRVVTDSTRELTEATEALFAIAQRTRSDFRNTAELYARVALAARDLGRSQEELLQFTESVNQAIIISGASAAEASNGLIQLSQGIASNTLRGDELRSVLEQLPVVADVIADSLGVTRGELRELGAAGAISAEIILDAFRDARVELEERFGVTVSTLGQAFQRLDNSLIRLVGRFNESQGATATLGAAIVFLAENLETTVEALINAGLVIGTLLAASALPGLIAAFRAATSALAALQALLIATNLSLGAQTLLLATLVGGVGLLATGFLNANRSTRTFTSGQETLAEALGVTADNVDGLVAAIARLDEEQRRIAQIEAGNIQGDLEADIASAMRRLENFVALVRATNASFGAGFTPAFDFDAAFEQALSAFESDRNLNRLRIAFDNAFDFVPDTARADLQEAFRSLLADPLFENFDQTVSNLQDVTELQGRLDRVSVAAIQTLDALGDAASDAGSMVVAALDSAGQSADAFGGALVDIRLADLIRNNDVAGLRELEQTLALNEARTETYSDVLEETGNVAAATAAALAAVERASAELDAERQREIDTADRAIRQIEAQLEAESLRASGLEALAREVEINAQAGGFYNQVLELLVQSSGQLTPAEEALARSYTATYRETLQLAEATRILDEERRRVTATDLAAEFTEEIGVLQQERDALLQGAAAFAEFNRQRAIAVALEQAAERATATGVTLGLEEIQELEQQITRLVDLRIEVRDLRSELTSAGAAAGATVTTVDDIVAALEEERFQLGLSNTERQVRQQLLAAELSLGRELVGPERDRIESLIRENELLAEQIRLYDDLRDPLLAYFENVRTLEGGVARAFIRLQDDAIDASQVAEDSIVGAFDGASASLAEFVRTGEFNFERLVSTLIDGLARLAIQAAIVQPLFQALGGVLGIGGSSAAGILAAPAGGVPGFIPATRATVSHAGGTIGADGGIRMVPSSLFLGAPRFHDGLYPGEFPAILQQGEVVTPRGEARRMGGDVNVNIIDQRTGVDDDALSVQEQVGADGGRSIFVFIRDTVRSEIAQQTRVGGMLNRV